jgi:hypothetical protein
MQISGTYNLRVNPEWVQLQLQKVYLEVDTSAEPCTINLFEVEALQRKWNVEIYITDISNNAGANNITIVAGGTDTIDQDGTTSLVINQNGGSVVLQPLAEKKWIGLESISGGVAPVTYLEYNALLSQAGGAVAPTAELNGPDGIGGVWSYGGEPGVYYYTKVGAFANAAKVEVKIQNMTVLAFQMTNQAFHTYSAKRIDDDTIEVRTATWTTTIAGAVLAVVPPDFSSVASAMQDGLMDRIPFNIKVWL